ncbi:Phasin (PHA-granule associated protein) [Burkholderia sp. AU33423]|uniref:Phasin protein n=1 Tax=Burkholderia contaminans TaxID=488447 RepID=A0A6P3AX04_9BURK|nr:MULTISPECIES: phasin family protein [Burkholderia]OXI77732.1 Phasin (PHA-granule associated protein) [Burkholderia sp. AU33423]VWD49168.1 phasin protein [Burkholderia contaminans]
MKTRERVSSAQRANFDFAFGLAGALLDEVGKLAELNARFTRSALKDAWAVAESAIDKPQDWTPVQRAFTEPLAEKLQSYSREWLEIVSSGHADVIKVAQAGSDQYVHGIQAFVDDAVKFAPSGSEATVAAWNSAIVAANTLYQTLGSTGQQAVEVARSNFDVAALAASKQAKRAVDQEQQAAKR